MSMDHQFVVNKNLPSPATYKKIILNTRRPIVLRNVPLGWQCLDEQRMPMSKWVSTVDADARYALDGAQFNFGKRTAEDDRQPQWEKNLTSGKLRISEFLCAFGDDHRIDDDPRWASFSYKNLCDLPVECQRGINLDALGIEQRQPEDFTFWLGSKDAHTPCHYDTYGLNVVVQVYGRKSWMLLPPETTGLNVTRVPYEESSVYCTENFFCPPPNWPERFAAIMSDVRHVILEPGDVLIVPPRWWHYAENCSVSLSVNSWIPLKSDLDAHIDECIVRINVTEYTRNMSNELRAALINPNELTNDMYGTAMSVQLELLERLAEYRQSAESWPVPSMEHNYLSPAEVQRLIDDCGDCESVRVVRQLTASEFGQLLAKNSLRHRNTQVENEKADDGPTDTVRMCSDFINAMCCPDSIERAKQRMLLSKIQYSLSLTDT